MGGVKELVSALEVGLAPELLDQQAHAGTAGVPEHQTSPGLILDREEVEVFADAAMVAAKRFFLATFVLRQLFRGFPGRAVDALQLRFGFIASPVSACHAFQLEGLGIELAGVIHVGASTEVPPVLTKGVEGDRLLQSFKNLELVGLVLGFDFFLGLVAAHLDAFERQLLVDDLDHPLLDGLQVGLGEGIGIVEVVIETCFGPGADGDACLGKQLLHSHGHHMAHGVPNLQQLIAFAGLGQNHRC